MAEQESFELQILRDKRWVVESVHVSEAEARAAANRLFDKLPDAESAKITRQVKKALGARWETVVAEIPRPATDNVLKLNGDPATAPVCKAITDIYGFPARLAVGRLFKMFLEQWQLTPGELLYSAAFLKRLDEQGSLLAAAMHQASVAQAKKLEQTTTERIVFFQAMWKQVYHQAQEYMGARRQLPRLTRDEENLPQLWERMVARSDGIEAAKYNLKASIVLVLQDMNSRAAKREWLLGYCAPELTDVRLIEILDGFIADTLINVQEVDDLVGHQISLLLFLEKIIKLIKGETAWIAPPQKELLRVAELIASKEYTQLTAVLIDCMIRLINSETPLDRRESDKEEALIRELQGKLMIEGHWLGGKGVQTAVENRRLRERKRKLRAMGLDDVADAVG